MSETRRIVRQFEDLIAWQKARALATLVFQVTEQPAVARKRRFCDQIEAAAVSSMNNIAEGFERESRPEFARFLLIAKASAGEVRSMAYVALDSGLVDQPTHSALVSAANDVSRLTARLRKSVLSSSRSAADTGVTPEIVEGAPGT